MRKSSSRTRVEEVRDARLIVVAAEGAYTERIYLTELAREHAGRQVYVKVLQREEAAKNNSSPAHVLAQLKQYEHEFSIGEKDELWLVIDRDRWTEQMLSEVAQVCQQDPNMKMALSNPCFELWLLLHLEDICTLPAETQQAYLENLRATSNADPLLKVRLRELMGSYHESSYDTMKLLPTVGVAITRAQEMDVNPQDRWPQTLGTRVYKLALSIIKEE